MPLPRVNYLGGPPFYNLQLASSSLVEALGAPLYLVGSALVTREFRDVDVRAIFEDAEFDRRFPRSRGMSPNAWDPLWCLLNAAISEWLAKRTNLPIDFQMQRKSQVEAYEPGQRYALGTFFKLGS